uniref:Proteasome maturation protein-like n=1 Tax=Ciona intestinalis TaxID=7719 RepID=F7AGE4_CIOIN|nr:proteasome maturation protein-like [Ciona intestinalis]|eukprot:XP_026693438.1 proteasome maturation protein-like [Ciona intestinalis]
MIRGDKFETKQFSTEADTEYGVTSSLRSGLGNVRSNFVSSHPLEKSEREYDDKMKQMNFNMLRNSQGIHAPLRKQMELTAINKATTRLPFLPTSNLSQDILNGNDACISIQDNFSHEDSEIMGDPHLMMEHKLGLKPL